MKITVENGVIERLEAWDVSKTYTAGDKVLGSDHRIYEANEPLVGIDPVAATQEPFNTAWSVWTVSI